MEAWGKNYSLKDEIILLADIKGDFTKSIGAEFVWRGWGLRSKRYTMLLEAGVIKKIVEECGDKQILNKRESCKKWWKEYKEKIQQSFFQIIEK